METYELLLKPEEVKKIVQDYIFKKTIRNSGNKQ